MAFFAVIGAVMLEDFTLWDLLNSKSSDGFVSQLRYIENEYSSEDFELFSQLNAHIVRWAIYYPFAKSGLHDSIVYILYLAPLGYALSQRKMLVVLLILLVMPFGLSFRAGLAAIGLTGFFLAILTRHRFWLLLLSSLLCVFSSATVFQSVLFMLYMWFKRGPKWTELIPAVILIYFLTVGVIDKVNGALLGEDGYIAEGAGSSNILISYVLRSTIIVSFLDNNPRAYVYLAMLVALLVRLLHLLLKRGEISGIRKVMLLCLIPGFALEGLGVVAAVPVMVWVFMLRYWNLVVSSEMPARTFSRNVLA